MTEWFGKKKTPDGTEIIRHDKVDTQIDVLGKNTSRFMKAREAAYEKLFGEPLGVSHELLPLVPHVDVYTFKRTSKKDGVDQVLYSLATGGMSDPSDDPPSARSQGCSASCGIDFSLLGATQGIHLNAALGRAFPAQRQIMAGARAHHAERQSRGAVLGQ
jgi:hypothetical protein